MNFADLDPALRPLLDRYLDPDDRARIEPLLTDLGGLAAGELDRLAATAEINVPALRPWSAAGERIDEVVFHPAYERMVEIGFCRFGLAALSHRGLPGRRGAAPHVVKYALSYLFSQAEYGLGCPINMTDSAARVLQMFDAEAFRPEIEALTSTDPATHATGAMFMTEVDGGTDLARTATVATDHGDHWTLSGRKWFCSNVTADVVLTLAQVPGQGEGTRGLGMFLLPRLRPDGSRNSYRIDRLKDKLGTHSMASGEVTLVEAYARPVGDLTRGVQQMLEMVNHSRVSNVMRSTALMRRAVHEAVTHARQRVVFGKALFDQPLMRRTLLGLQLDTEAALGIVLEIGDLLERGDAGDERARTAARVLTPVAKHSVCKRARWVTAEAMEVRGGNGYIEDWINPRLVRDAHLGSIWEGASNVVALDVLRCMRRQNAHQVLADTYLGRLDPAVTPLAPRLAAHWRALRERGDALLTRDREQQEFAAGDYTEALAQAVMAALLVEQAAWEAEDGRGERKLLVAEAYLQRLFTPDEIPTAALDALATITEGAA
ncbi:alkylation response protein AidB-like acyl-CoA dehydrogenase [Pseudonocardia kunmingensis]|uniref:Alkylation response protein AidB-like acyl-CoA dehydrogenase n=2 Tax=Pseudonocardia kunmingensis TaxID=630975 RepID=A0A543DNN5_9PSEU|nr:acyl-CoA dehydrogenase family protein [Pseudonocardia kunmingensis]TQM10905.1 alkylation response protein AidB-like acyl-CoA dehydrogenase [Pseudonocardia kunmingensis]